MGTTFSKVSPCCGWDDTPSDITNELRSPIRRYNKLVEQKIDKNDELKQEQSEQDTYIENEQNLKITAISYKSQHKKIEIGASISADVYSMSMPKSLTLRHSKSCIIALTAKHRYKLNQKRESTLLVRRAKQDFSLPLRINEICQIFANYINENNSTDDNSEKEIDLFQIEITYSQFNIVLNNNSIQISPDMTAALIWQLLGINHMISDELSNIGLETQNLHNDPMKERSFHQKQFKLISKCVITYNMIKCLMEQLNTNNLIIPWDKITQAKNLSYKKRNFVIWDMIFKNLSNRTAFNVENDYLYGVLSEADMSNIDNIIELLSTLQSHWKHRIQVMKYIDNQLTSEHYNDEIIDNETFTHLLSGWSVQLTEDRSAVSRIAVSLLPTVLSSLLLNIQYPAILFSEENIINPMFNGIFILIKNKRLKDLADDAYQAFIQITDIFAEIATDLQDYDLLKTIIKMFEDHSNPNIEKHFKVRESCIGGIGFVLYGVDNESVTAPMEDINENEEDIKLNDVIEEKIAAKLSKQMQRKYLLNNEEFIKSVGNVLKNGITDKNELCRKKSFELLKKLDENEQDILDDIAANWDFIITKKYNSFKRLQTRKKEKTTSWRRNQKKKVKKKKKEKQEEVY